LPARSYYSPNLRDERHVIEDLDENGRWVGRSTYDSGWDWWNGCIVGGASNFTSGFFHRLKPKDFKLLSAFGPIEGANIADRPISYDDMEPYFEKGELLNSFFSTPIPLPGRLVLNGTKTDWFGAVN